MTRQQMMRGFGVFLVSMMVTAGTVAAGGGKTVGKNPGKIKGRWLEVEDASALSGYTGVYLGEIKTDIEWKNKRNEAPIDEELLNEKIEEQLMMNLKASSLFADVLKEAPEAGAAGNVRLDCDLKVEPGSRLARYAVGLGAGKSRSIFEIHLRDHGSGEEIGLYHGYGVGSGMGFKVGGGGARKMTEDDIQENTKNFVKLLAEVK